MEAPQHRGVVMAPNGVVAAAHPLAAAAGLEALLSGGNAIDAALTTAGVMGVVQPMMSGLGGDTFLLYYQRAERRLWAINGSGPAPRALSVEYLQAHRNGHLPARGMLSAGVPGAVDAMCTALERWGSGQFDLPRILAPAIRYAEQGVPVGQGVAARWGPQRDVLAEYAGSDRVYLRDGHPYRAGDVLRLPELAASLRLVARGGREVFYRGELAEHIARYSREHGGLIDEADLAAYQCEVYEPISSSYRDYTVYTTAPPSQGAILLDALLSKYYATERRAAIHDDLALDIVAPGALPEAVGDTTYLCAADRDGNLVSLITSLSNPFGCADVVDGTGILLNNRVGRGFSVDPTHLNVVMPGKRTMHTLHCYMVFRGETPHLVGGTPGGDG